MVIMKLCPDSLSGILLCSLLLFDLATVNAYLAGTAFTNSTSAKRKLKGHC